VDHFIFLKIKEIGKKNSDVWSGQKPESSKFYLGSGVMMDVVVFVIFGNLINN
jgi:hypothetical protein